MRFIKQAMLAAVLLSGTTAFAQGNGQYGYHWRVIYYSDAAKTTRIGTETLFCNADEPLVRGETSEFYDYLQGICD